MREGGLRVFDTAVSGDSHLVDGHTSRTLQNGNFCTNLALFILKIQNFLKICQKLEKIGDFDVF